MVRFLHSRDDPDIYSGKENEQGVAKGSGHFSFPSLSEFFLGNLVQRQTYSMPTGDAFLCQEVFL